MTTSVNYRISLLLKQIEYKYITYKNNRDVERAFVSGFHDPPLEKALAFTRDHPLFLAIFATAFIGMSVAIVSKPVNVSKPFSQSPGIDKKIEKRLASIQPAAPNIERLKKSMTQQTQISPFPVDPVISREVFMEKQAQYTLLVNKRTRKLFVTKENDSGYSVIEEFPISFGLISGNKEIEGDKKTPEGTYTLIELKLDEELPAKYGPYAAVLNYPNEMDLQKGKTGSGIWIHGTGTNQLTPDTKGCVELSDDNLIQLFRFISKGTKIIIASENIDITPKTDIVQKSLVNLATTS